MRGKGQEEKTRILEMSHRTAEEQLGEEDNISLCATVGISFSVWFYARGRGRRPSMQWTGSEGLPGAGTKRRRSGSLKSSQLCLAGSRKSKIEASP